MVPDPSGLCESVSVLGPSGLQGEQRGFKHFPWGMRDGEKMFKFEAMGRGLTLLPPIFNYPCKNYNIERILTGRLRNLCEKIWFFS
jgi:hypothetical protein